jgi:type II secretory ATPase GspE/PulE/Tfp pilus assembly ATPase PilB-like protein
MTTLSHENFWEVPEDMRPDWLVKQVAEIDYIRGHGLKFGQVLVYRGLASESQIEELHSSKPRDTLFGDYLMGLSNAKVSPGLKDGILPAAAACNEKPLLFLSKRDALTVVISTHMSSSDILNECLKRSCVIADIGGQPFVFFSDVETYKHWTQQGVPELLESAIKSKIKTVAFGIADPEWVSEILKRYSSSGAEGDKDKGLLTEGDLEASGVEIQSYLTKLLNYANRVGASDIHFMPSTSGNVTVRVRVYTVLRPVPVNLELHIKQYHELKTFLVSRSNATESNAPVFVPCDGDAVDYIPRSGGRIRLRLSFVPLGVDGTVTENLVRIVSRLQPMDANVKKLSELGITHNVVLSTIADIVEQRGQMVVMAGPMGSGKTTTMYATLLEIADYYNGSQCIASIEDPIEQLLPGIDQIEISRKAHKEGKGYAEYLKNLKRQDTNVLYLGEIRDEETAVNCGQYAAIGNKVLTTIHSRSEVEALIRFTSLIPRKEDLQLLVSSLSHVLTQRIIPILCSHCKKEIEFTPQLRAKAEKYLVLNGYTQDKASSSLSSVSHIHTHGTDECNVCNGERIERVLPVIGVLPVTSRVRNLVLSNVISPEDRDQELYSLRSVTMTDQVLDLFTSGAIALESINHG